MYILEEKATPGHLNYRSRSEKPLLESPCIKYAGLGEMNFDEVPQAQIFLHVKDPHVKKIPSIEHYVVSKTSCNGLDRG